MARYRYPSRRAAEDRFPSAADGVVLGYQSQGPAITARKIADTIQIAPSIIVGSSLNEAQGNKDNEDTRRGPDHYFSHGHLRQLKPARWVTRSTTRENDTSRLFKRAQTADCPVRHTN